MKRTPPATVSASSPVTKDEVRLTVNRVENAIKKVVPKYTAAKAIPLSGDQPATRTEVILQLDRLFQGSKSAFRFSPKKVTYDAATVTVRDPAAKKALENLVAWGFVGKATPLMSSEQETIGLADYGDALGFFIARLSELTHTPSSKFSPSLQRGG